MDQNIGEMINECAQMQDEIALLTPVILSLSPSLSMENMTPREISKASRDKIQGEIAAVTGSRKREGRICCSSAKP